MTALVVVEGLALLLLGVLVAGVLVAGLLRSHAEILRRLHVLDAGAEGSTPGEFGPVDLEFPVPPGRALPRAAGGVLTAATDVEGATPRGEAVRVAVAGTRHDTLLAFLSSGCLTCQTFWQAFASRDGLGLPAEMRLVVVTRSADEESVSRLCELAPPGLPVVLSSEAWGAYEVPVAPYFVQVSGAESRVVGEGAASAWEQVAELVRTSSGDRAAVSAVRAQIDLGAAGADGGALREQRADRELLAAGITPGDPSLYLTADDLGLEQQPGARRREAGG